MRRLTVILSTALVCAPAVGSVMQFDDRAEWEAAVGTFTTIDFVLPPIGTPITDQYGDVGVHFSGFVFSHESGSFVNDGWGMHGAGGAWVHFDKPQRWLGIDLAGWAFVDLYFHGEHIFTSDVLGDSGTGLFGGLISQKYFDTAYFYRTEPHVNAVFIDDLHFGVPAPGALGVFALAALSGRRRRRAR